MGEKYSLRPPVPANSHKNMCKINKTPLLFMLNKTLVFFFFFGIIDKTE